MKTVLLVTFALVFATIVGSIILAGIHDILKCWFEEAKDSNVHIGPLNRKKICIIVGISFWFAVTLLAMGMNK